MLTELTFCRKSSINVLIDNRYYNRFIHLRRQLFPMNHNGAPLCLQFRRFGVTLSRHRSPNLRPECRIIGTRQLNALSVPSTHYVQNNCIYIQSHLLAGKNSIAIDLMAIKDFFFLFFSQHRAPAPMYLLFGAVYWSQGRQGYFGISNVVLVGLYDQF